MKKIEHKPITKANIRLRQSVVWADYNTIFEYTNEDGIEWLHLIEGNSLWYLLDLIQAVWIEDDRYFEKMLTILIK